MPLPFANFFGSLQDFLYSPYTSWEGMWEEFFSPRFYFGCNVADAPVERRVLDEVGSYGSQLNIVLDAMVVFLQHLRPETLTEDERRRILDLVDLMDRADRSSARLEHKKPQMLALQLAPWVQPRMETAAAGQRAAAAGGSAP
jgi:hypothetical protein